MQQQQVCEPNQVLQLLLRALSHDQAMQKQAEQALHSLESQPGYVSCLAAIVANGEANHSARWMASVQLKNTVSKQWRPRYDSRGVSQEEKAYMRQHILDLISQDDSKIAVQVALVVAKIARSDYPREWPTLVSDLLGRVHGGSTLTVRRVYFVMHHVLKELSSKRLAADQRNFAEASAAQAAAALAASCSGHRSSFARITAQLLDHVWGQWCSDLNTIVSGLPSALAAPSGAAAQPLLLHFERWLLLLKILRRLIVFGFQSDARTLEPVPAVSTCAPALLQAAGALAAARPERAAQSRVVAMVDRGVLKLVKTLCQIQEAHP
ncbi:Importin-11, partial [Monoraphidium neglectum]